MLKINKKQNIVIRKKGFVLLFALFLTSIILFITLSLSKIAQKEIVLQTSAKNTNNAFLAADTGAECAIYHDVGVPISHFGLDPNDPDNPFYTSCAGTDIDIFTPIDTNKWEFVLPQLGENGIACVIVKVDKSAPDNTVKITSKGYSSGGDTINCTSSNPSRVERVIEINY